jgi:hypothetical protein
MRVIVASVLIAFLAMNQAWAQQPDSDSTEKQIIATRPGSLVEIRTKSGALLRGRIESHTDAGFSLRADKRGNMQALTYSQVASVSQVKHRHSHTMLIVGAVVAGAAAVVIVVIILAKTHTIAVV